MLFLCGYKQRAERRTAHPRLLASEPSICLLAMRYLAILRRNLISDVAERAEARGTMVRLSLSTRQGDGLAFVRAYM